MTDMTTHPGTLTPALPPMPDPSTATTEELVEYARMATATAAKREAAFAGEPVRRSPVTDTLALPYAGGIADIPALIAEGLVPPGDGDLAEVAVEYAAKAEAYRAAALDAELDAGALLVIPSLPARLDAEMARLGSLSRATTERVTTEHREEVAAAEERVAASRARAAAYAAPLRHLFLDLVHLPGALGEDIAKRAAEAEEALLPEVAAARAALAAAEAKVRRVRNVPAYFSEVAKAVPAGGLPPIPSGLALLDVPEWTEEEEAPAPTPAPCQALSQEPERLTTERVTR